MDEWLQPTADYAMDAAASAHAKIVDLQVRVAQLEQQVERLQRRLDAATALIA